MGEGSSMRGVDGLRSALAAAREELLASVAGIDCDTFAAQPGGDDGPAIRDVMWRAGLREDWTRRAIDQGLRGQAAGPLVDRPRPAIARTPEYLVAWLEQTRAPLFALLRRLPEDALAREFSLSDTETATADALLRRLDREERADAEQVQRLRALAQAGR